MHRAPASHEAIEAATDPLPQTAPAFFDVDFAGSGWSTASGGSEIGISVAAGSSTTVDVHLYADTPGIGTWTIAASEPTLPQLPDPYGQLTLSLDRTTGASGDVLHLTIKRRAPPKGQPAFGAPFVITSTQGTATHSYWGVVGN